MNYIKDFFDWCIGKYGLNLDGNFYECEYGEDIEAYIVFDEYNNENNKFISNFIKWCKDRYGFDGDTGELYDEDEKTVSLEEVFAIYESEK